MAEILKTCKTCQEPKQFSEFPSYTRRSDKKRMTKPVCRKCCNERDRVYKRNIRIADPDYYARELERNKTYRHRYSDGYIQHQLRKREKNVSNYHTNLFRRLQHMTSCTKSRSVKKGFGCEITAEILFVIIQSQGMKCAVTGIPFDLSAHKNYHKNPYAPSIDRIVQAKGYTLDNIQIVCSWYNMMKNEWSDDDVRSFVYVAYHTMFKGA